MKRFLIAFLLAAAFLGLLATPALALRPSLKTAYVVPKAGVWLEVIGDVNAPQKGVHPLLTSPIPSDYDVVIDAPWRGITKGLVQTVPLALLYKLSIPAAGVDLSYEQAKAYWSGAVLWDQYWIDLWARSRPST